MPLCHEPDVSNADWFTDRGEPWTQLCSIGPSGFARYARLFHPAGPDDDVNDPHHLENLEGNLDPDVLGRLLRVLARHTTTPQDCFFCLWDGFGDIHGSPSVGVLTSSRTRRAGHQPMLTVAPAFPPEVLNGPRVSIPARSYLLFRGPLSQAGQWGAADLVPGRLRPINSPNLIWPADHSWFVATDIDLPWTGIAGSAELVQDLITDESLDVELIELTRQPPYWRNGDSRD
jgi:hypothetical protein